MATIKELRKREGNKVRISMTCSSLPIQSADVEWINPTTKRRIDGVTLERREGEGYAELDLDNPKDAETYRRFKSWLTEYPLDPRIEQCQVHELSEGEAGPPFPWWPTTSAEKLLTQIKDGLGAMEDLAQRQRFIEHCLLYERQNKNRKVFISQVEALELTAPAPNALDVPADEA